MKPPSGFIQLDVPIGGIDARQERPPLPIATPTEFAGNKRRPFGSPRCSDQGHPGLVRSIAALTAITLEARTDDVFPTCAPPGRPRDYMIQVELASGQPVAAVLAGVAIAHENVVAREPDPPAGNSIETDQQDYPGDAQHPSNHPDPVLPGGQLGPRGEVEGLVLLVNRSSHSPVEQTQRSPHRSDMNRQEGLVQHQGPAADCPPSCQSSVHFARLAARFRQSRLHNPRLYVDMAPKCAKYLAPWRALHPTLHSTTAQPDIWLRICRRWAPRALKLCSGRPQALGWRPIRSSEFTLAKTDHH
jgi:hypothetical protein